ncbi:serine-threonine protein kinase [Streptomyces sp. NPDC127084]|uniref:serine-threonine protein kinase n=1 Tax=Streptomyces sp. NPDC127084 TaxID=3347133 RepID=UPI00364D68AB
MGAEPYVELTFDAQGDVHRAQRDALAELDVTDLVMFAHGWNNSPSVARRFYERFFEPFPRFVASGATVGYVGVVWPSMMFTDEPIPDFGTLAGVFPGQERTLSRLAALLADEPENRAAFQEFGVLVRELVDTCDAGSAEACVGDLAGPDGEDIPAFLEGDPVEICRLFTATLDGTEPSLALGSGLRRLWKGGREVLRQATYYTMKRRAGTVGERGLGPVIAHLSRSSPAIRIHLAGHSMGARLVAFALRGLPDGIRTVKSVTLLQGAFSHYAFAPSLPHARESGGVLRAMEKRVDGPVVACYSHHDSALGVLYPLAARMARDSSSIVGLDKRWWAVGHDGIQAVTGARRLTLEAALRDGLPGSGCVSVDTAAVVRSGGPPSGAHSDILHPELARVVLRAGRIGR